MGQYTLTPAKCPNCKAAIKINADSRRAVCEFCGTDIIVTNNDEIKVELRNTYEEKQLEIVNKYMHINRFSDAIEVLDNLLEINPYNAVALAIKLDYLIKEMLRDTSHSRSPYYYYKLGDGLVRRIMTSPNSLEYEKLIDRFYEAYTTYKNSQIANIENNIFIKKRVEKEKANTNSNIIKLLLFLLIILVFGVIYVLFIVSNM